MLNELIKSIYWLPPYTIYHSVRARRMILKISLKKGLQIIVPMQFSFKKIDILNFLTSKKNWILKHSEIIYQHTRMNQTSSLPTELDLKSCGEKWDISYIFSSDNLQISMSPLQKLILQGNTDDIKNCQFILKKWLKNKAKLFLTDYLQFLAKNYGFIFKKMNIRDQKTRWGSCSSSGNINLNFRLIFLPIELTRHILLHELCHTLHLNHSKDFRQLLAKYDNNWQNHQKILKKNYHLIPTWIT